MFDFFKPKCTVSLTIEQIKGHVQGQSALGDLLLDSISIRSRFLLWQVQALYGTDIIPGHNELYRMPFDTYCQWLIDNGNHAKRIAGLTLEEYVRGLQLDPKKMHRFYGEALCEMDSSPVS
jgi:hypothetical protein